MLSLIVQSLTFAIFIGVFLVALKILKDRVWGLKWTFVSVLFFWLTGVMLTDLNFVSLTFLVVGIVTGIYGLILLSRERDKNEKNKITSIESAIDSIIEKNRRKRYNNCLERS